MTEALHNFGTQSMQSPLESPTSPQDRIDSNFLSPRPTFAENQAITYDFTPAALQSQLQPKQHNMSVTWSQQFNDSSNLARYLQDLGQLKLPRDEQPQGTAPLERFMSEDVRTLVSVNETPCLPSQARHRPSISLPAYSYAPSGYQPSFDETSSVNSECWRSRQSPDTSTTGFTDPLTRGGRHSHSSSYDGCLSPSSPMGGFHSAEYGPYQRRLSIYSAESNGESDRLLSQNGTRGYVDPKKTQLTIQDEEKEESEEFESDYNDYNAPASEIHAHQEAHNDWQFPGDPSQYAFSPQLEGIGYCHFPQTPMEVQTTSQQDTSPCKIKMDTSGQQRRRNKSGSGSLMFSSKLTDAPRLYKNNHSHNGDAKVSKCRGGSGNRKIRSRRCNEHPNQTFKHDSDYRKHMQNKHIRPFICTFYFANCTQTFGSKNEWKRHVYSQHLQLHYWHCDDHLCRERNAVFNRKDLFGQHLKRMHSPAQLSQTTPVSGKKRAMEPLEMQNFVSKEIPLIQDRCKKERRKPPFSSRCGFCSQEFQGENSWEIRMEHVGKHYEQSSIIGARSSEDEDFFTSVDSGSWKVDEALVDWAVGEEIVRRIGDKFELVPVSKEVPNVKGRGRKMVGHAHEDEDAEGECEYLTT
ncbi:hypothetical protein RUND412_007094 [Rhizina undulata]